jgi:molybdate transport system ATP-binding protein
MIKIDISKKLHGSVGEMELGIDIEIEEGSFVALSGESGSGKTTFLRVLAGLEDVDEGTIKVQGKLWLDKRGKKSFCLTPQKREIGFVFQDYALFPNMTILENLLYVKKDLSLALKLLEMVELEELKHRFPSSLSGGQKQRVSLIRALMSRPKVLLLDEPLSALDPAMRTKLQQEILTLHKEFKITTILVSHDPSEIYRLSDRVIVLKEGKLKNDGNPKEVLLRTAGSQKFSFEGELLDIFKMDVLNIAVVSIANQLVEVVLDSTEAKELKAGDIVSVSTKAFSPVVTKVR